MEKSRDTKGEVKASLFSCIRKPSESYARKKHTSCEEAQLAERNLAENGTARARRNSQARFFLDA